MSAAHSIQPDSPRRTTESEQNGASGGNGAALSRLFALYVGLLCIVYAIPLWRLFLEAWENEAHSHILLVPIVSLYLLVTSSRQWISLPRSRPRLALIPAFFGLLAAGGMWWARSKGVVISEHDHLSVMIVSFLCMLVAGGFWFLGGSVMRQLAFPAAFLAFMIPVPHRVMEGVNIFLQHASAEAANLMLHVGGPPFVREGLLFQLPGITLLVAEECSGVRSTLVLFITSILASYLFLRSGWRRSLLVAVVLPIAIIRNGFRIYVIAMLCVHIDPSMIHSIIHKRGGPLFFALSLIPLFALLVWLRRREQVVTDENPRLDPSLNRGDGVK
ncbi:MAG: exosortase [Opitutaceae bacterium]|nr:exosortase [Verrucomicrobiales bacterium]